MRMRIIARYANLICMLFGQNTGSLTPFPLTGSPKKRRIEQQQREYSGAGLHSSGGAYCPNGNQNQNKLENNCAQYECVGRPAACDRNTMEPACDTDGLVHRSLCRLQQAGKTLAYMGHCQVGNTGTLKSTGLSDTQELLW
ncbi:hypothetical protein XENOCAPTIV_012272 [Xenoophorus captivus]|uniref:Kazal-like domain-containing protein n=1 Tax=Xenoophorus captivus TaxID=1517983 RepID=A0ABV0SEX6_9TELE